MAALAAPLLVPAAEALWGAILVAGSAAAAALGLVAISKSLDKSFPAQKTGAVAQCPLQAQSQPGSVLHAENEGEKDAAKVGEAPTPEDLKGKSPAEIEEMMKNKGWPSEPSRNGDGVRYPNPEKNGDQVRVMPGKATDPNPVKQGPYGRISTNGTVSEPIPLEGNPTLK